MLMPWNESNNLGFLTLDNLHRELYEMFNELSQAMTEGNGKALAANVMDRLLPLFRTHIEEEEKALRQLNSAAYTYCCARNVQELEIIRSFLKDKDANDPSAVIDLLYFLDSLLDGHIDADRRSLGRLAHGVVQ
jgi:hemerythrin-like metal-binding protein